jgi:hypothetical protein
MTAAGDAWDVEQQDGWSVYSSSEAASWDTFVGAEDSEWNSYTGFLGSFQSDLNAAVADAQGLFISAMETPTTNWHSSEGDAWATYLNDLGGATPEERITAPPALPELDPAPELPIQPRDPGEFLAGEDPAGRIVRLGRNLNVYAVAQRALQGAAILLFNIAANAFTRDSIRGTTQTWMNDNGMRWSGVYQYTGAVRTLADNGGAGDLIALENQAKEALEAPAVGFTNVSIAHEAFVTYCVSQAERNPRSGNVAYVVRFRMVITATPPGGGAAITLHQPVGAFVGEFNDPTLVTTTLTPPP